MRTFCFSAVPANLFKIAAAGKAADPHCRPSKLRHNLCEFSKRASGPVALWDFEQIQECLRADALQPIIKVDFAPHALKREPPGISQLCRGF